MNQQTENRPAAGSAEVDWTCPDALVTCKDLAERHRTSERTKERGIQDGSGPPHLKVGKKVLFRIRDVLDWEEDHLFGSTAEAKAAKEHEAAEAARRYEERQRTITEAKGAKAAEATAARRRHQKRQRTTAEQDV